MNSNREDYIKSIYELSEFNTQIHNKMIAAKLNVSPASVSEMLTKLIKADLVKQTNDASIVLTGSGRKLGEKLLRKHRLWETFLVNNLGYRWEEIHDDAEVLEHVTSPMLEERLNHFLNQPEYCPHGSPIYGNTTDKRHLVPLSSLKENDHGTFARVHDDQALLAYLSSLSFVINDSFVILKIHPYEGPFELSVNDRIIQLSYKAANEIYVSANL